MFLPKGKKKEQVSTDVNQIHKQSYEPEIQSDVKNLIVHFMKMDAILKLWRQTARETYRSTLAWGLKAHFQVTSRRSLDLQQEASG